MTAPRREYSPGFEDAMNHFTATNDANPLREILGLPPRCVDCGEVDHLNSDGACPSCQTERMLDQAEHYAEES